MAPGSTRAGNADIFSSVNGPASASVAGTGSSWTIDGLLSIGASGLGAGAASVQDGGAIIAGGVVIDTLGAFLLGQGGLAGTLSTAAIENNGAFVASFTDTATVSSVISGTGTLTKGSLGTLILTGASNGFLGATTVNGGVLQVDGSLTGSSIAVNGGTLGGNGSTGGVTVNAGGIVSAGASAGKLTTGTLAFASSAVPVQGRARGHQRRHRRLRPGRGQWRSHSRRRQSQRAAARRIRAFGRQRASPSSPMTAPMPSPAPLPGSHKARRSRPAPPGSPSATPAATATTWC